MNAQLKKGLTDLCVLATLKQGESYGYKIVTDLSPFLALSESTLYPVLRRLESRGEVISRTEENNGRLRRYYRLTPDGLTKLDECAETLLTFQKISDFIRNGGTL